ncbi:MAG: TatD family hydrolase, partial [Candidatus Paceibacteria bacterium]
RGEKFDYNKYKDLVLSSNKVLAIGEIGLDYYYLPKSKTQRQLAKEKQKQCLTEQLKLAKELKLPVIFHCRLAHQDLINLLKENPALKPVRAVAHGFVGALEDLNVYLELGFYIGFNGIIFKKIQGIDFKAIVKLTPPERILLETDCPYLTPPQEGQKRNEPMFITHIAQLVAELKGIALEKLIEISTDNACKLFGLNL